jgi:hypothetical protein
MFFAVGVNSIQDSISTGDAITAPLISGRLSRVKKRR